MESVILLIGVVYVCENNHKLMSYDPCLLQLIPDEKVTPFVLSYRSGFTRRFLRNFISQFEQGYDFSKVVSTIKSCREQLYTRDFFRKCNEKDSFTIRHLPLPSRFTLTSLLLQCFFQEKETEIHQEMKKMSCDKWISIDHTFKVAANVAYYRSDKTWVTQYRSLFIVLNERGQVLTWQFTKSEATSEVAHLLEGLRCRLRMQNAAVEQVILDDCCK